MEFSIEEFSKHLDYVINHAKPVILDNGITEEERIINDLGVPKEYLEGGNSTADFIKKRNEDFINKLKERFGIDEA